jgi:glycosyltransferase involved in cell wall biosynthesis
MLRPYQGSRCRSMTWLPVPSTIPVFAVPDRTEAIRQGLVADGGIILGTFGTFSPLIRGMLRRALPVLLASRKDRACLLLGRNSEGFALELVARHPELAGRVVGRGGLGAEELSAHLQACDVLVQPYPDGVSSRRTTLMAALAHGVPAVTTLGFLSDPIWAESGCAVLVPASDPGGMIRAAESLLGDPEARARLRLKAQDVYRKQFDLQNTIEELLRP